MSMDQQVLALGRVYAQSLLGLAESRGRAEQVAADMAGLGEVLAAQPELVGYFSSPLVNEAARANVVEKAFRGKADDLVVDTLQVMNRKGRLGLAAALVEAFRQAYDALQGRIEATVTTAVPLSENLRTKVSAAVLAVANSGGLTAKTVMLLERVDASLLGGMIVQLGDRKIDTSVAREISMMGESLALRTSQEIQDSNAYVSESD